MKFFIILAVLASLVSADIVPTNFAVLPATLKPGVSGSLSFTLTNTGNVSISDVAIYPSGPAFQFFSEKISAGSIGAGSTSPINIPLKVNDGVTTGVYEITLNTYWIDSQGTHFKSFSVPVTITNEATFQLSGIAYDVGQIHPADAFVISAILTNTGGKAKNIKITTNSTDFQFSGSSQIFIGDMDKDASTQIHLPLVAGSGLTPKAYTIQLTVSYENELGTQQTAALAIGPVNIYRRPIYFGMTSGHSPENVLPGQSVTFSVNLTNVGGEQARYVRVALVPASDSFVLLDSGEKYVEAIDPRGNAEVSFRIGVNPATVPGFYSMQVVTYFSNSRGEEQTAQRQDAGIEISSAADVDVIASTAPAPVSAGKRHSLSLQVSNIGTSQMRSVRVSIASDAFDLLTSPDSYLGTLNADDYSSATYPVVTKQDIAPGRYPINVTIAFRDADNVEKTIVKSGYIDVVSQDIAQRAQTRESGAPLWMWFIGVAVVAVAAYLVYARYVKKK